MNRAELIAQVRGDLDQVHDRILWAHTDGHYPTNATPTRRTSPTTGTPSTTPADPDQVPGARYDIGIGNHPARRAFQTAVAELARTEGYLQVATYLAAPGRQPRAVRPTWEAGPAQITLCVNGCRRRLTLIATAGPSAQADRLLEQAARAIDHAWKHLAQLDSGDTAGVATAEKPCRICGVRPQAEKKGERCNTCASWFRRNGYERPRKLDEDAVGQARKAQARRRARGEGWGDEAYSAVGRWPELEEQLRRSRQD